MPKNAAYYSSPIGMLKIKADEDAITEVYFVDEKISPPNFKITKTTNPQIVAAAKQLDEYFHKERVKFDLRLSPNGTEFQKEVWGKLNDIKFGKTSSYLAIAKQLGDENKNRAVGMANGKNPIAIIIPCHRVIGADGSLVGYAGGLERKKWLLQHEAEFAQGELF